MEIAVMSNGVSTVSTENVLQRRIPIFNTLEYLTSTRPAIPPSEKRFSPFAAPSSVPHRFCGAIGVDVAFVTMLSKVRPSPLIGERLASAAMLLNFESPSMFEMLIVSSSLRMFLSLLLSVGNWSMWFSSRCSTGISPSWVRCRGVTAAGASPEKRAFFPSMFSKEHMGGIVLDRRGGDPPPGDRLVECGGP
ncbi:hypothetical protein NQ318_019616 [Aromia moschata]|uniref:Uncharacterized protein n=1 Tax=Aromia moschata TaxID=1265417 RepID=A0AAV8Z4V7_9CUCU|nr:hypothetical protein NQ318_019616 [Aromia moschata]